jgi:hypothetical protein
MVTEEEAAPPVEVDPGLVGVLDLAPHELPYVDLNDAPLMHTQLRLGETEYAYVRSFPIKGHSAVMPAAVEELLAQGKQILIAEHNERYYIYAA